MSGSDPAELLFDYSIAEVVSSRVRARVNAYYLEAGCSDYEAVSAG